MATATRGEVFDYWVQIELGMRSGTAVTSLIWKRIDGVGPLLQEQRGAVVRRTQERKVLIPRPLAVGKFEVVYANRPSFRRQRRTGRGCRDMGNQLSHLYLERLHLLPCMFSYSEQKKSLLRVRQSMSCFLAISIH